MHTLSDGSIESIVPTETEVLLAQESIQRLFSFIEKKNELSVRIKETGKKTEEITLPASAFSVLLNILTEIAQGHKVTLISEHTELTTQQAAEFLNVSRPFLVRMLDEGKIPCRKVGTHRRVLFSDLKSFNEQNKKERAKVLAELSEQAQRFDMGY